MSTLSRTAHYHLPGLFEFYDFYKLFLPLFYEQRDWFYDWCDIGSIYGAPADCLWGGGRVGFGDNNADDVLALMEQFGISSRLTFSNSLLQKEHLADKKCNELCRKFEQAGQEIDSGNSNCSATGNNGVIVHSDLLVEYLKKNYPFLYLVSSTTKVLTKFADFKTELEQTDKFCTIQKDFSTENNSPSAEDTFAYVVPDFRLNKDFENLNTLPQHLKDKVEFLCNECCWTGCRERKNCYENVSRKSLGENVSDHICHAPGGNSGYVFSKAMESPAFIGIEDIQNTYLPTGFTNFKIEGRGLGSAILLEFILYYMTRPEHQLKVREKIYLDCMLDLF